MPSTSPKTTGEPSSKATPPETQPRRFPTWLLYAIPIIIIIGGYLVWEFAGDEDEDDEVDTAALSSAEYQLDNKECAGDFIDTHAHWDNEEYPQKALERMQENSVGCAVLFTSMSPANTQESLLNLQEDLDPYAQNFIPFFHINPQSIADVTVANVTAAHRSRDDYFAGFGESAFYRDPLRNSHLTDENWQPILQYLSDNNLWFMFHLRGSDQLVELSTVLQSYPDLKFLLHGPELYRELPELLSQNTNLYFTLDTASLVQLPSGMIGSILMYPDGFAKGDFIAQFDQNKDAMLQSAVSKWKPTVVAAPDRVFWGTDISLDWHTDKDVYDRLISFSREFAAQLPADAQGAYLFDNAQRLLVE